MEYSRLGWVSGAVVLLVAGVSLPAQAGPIFQPNNTQVPTGNGVQGVFDGLNDPIDAIQDAEVEPERFLAGCTASFTVHARFAAYKNSFGWYNVTGDVPAISDLHQILDCTDGPGVSKEVNILSDPDYAGGEIGFFQAVGNCADVANPNTIFNVGNNKKHIVYSEPELNPDNNLPDPYIHLLIYPSIKNPRTYYFAWEDLLQGGDNDFADLLTSVAGIECSGWPKACQPLGSEGDADADLICEPNDNCPNDANADQADADMDGIGDACDECPDDPDPDCVMVEPTTTGDSDSDTDTTGGTDGTTGTTGDSDSGTTDTGVTSTGDTGGTDGTSSGTAGTTGSSGTAGTTAGTAGSETGGTGDSNSGTGGTAGSDSASDGSDSAASASAGSASAGSSSSTGDGSATGGADDSEGCACSTSSPRSPGIGSLFALLLLAVRRRRA